MKALATKQDDRYVEVKSLQKEIENYQMGFATGAEQAGVWKQLCLLVKRNKGVFTALAACLLVIILGSAAFIAKVMASEQRAMQALARFQAEQTARAADRKASAPSLVRSAKVFVEQKDMIAARTLVDTALEYDPEQAEALLLKIILCREVGDYAGAQARSAKYLEQFPGDGEGKALLRVAEVALKQGVTNAPRSMVAGVLVKHGLPNLASKYSVSIAAVLPEYRRRLEAIKPGLGAKLADNQDGTLSLDLSGVREVVSLKPLEGMPLSSLNVAGCVSVDDLSPLTGMPLTSLTLYGCSGVTDLRPLKGLPLTSLSLSGTKVRDLTPLKGIPLTSLSLSGNGMAISDLTPLKGMPLHSLNLQFCIRVQDLTPLKGMPLTSLDIHGTSVSDLSPLNGMQLTWLSLYQTRVTDLAPLKGMPLTKVEYLLPANITNGVDAIREMKSLAEIGIQIGGGGILLPAADFWKRYDAGEFEGK
jgi:hypothetical protein